MKKLRMIKNKLFTSEKIYKIYETSEDLYPILTTGSKWVWKSHKWETRTGKKWSAKINWFDKLRIKFDI